jgi:nucleoside-diphosphate-sugar epimerase
MLHIGVTGYTGFVGRRYLEQPEAGRVLSGINLRNVTIQNIDLSSTNIIVHLAGKAHEMNPIPDEVYYEVNFEMTRELADHARASGVKQFVYISSTKVYGDNVDHVLSEYSDCHPSDPYGKSKRMAEEYLLSMNSDSFKVAIVRPPLVYGPGVKGNMVKLLQLAEKNIILPLGKVGNRRSMVFVDNLIALINKIIAEEASGIFIAGDSRPVSTDELVGLIRKSMNKSASLVSIPAFFRTMIRNLKPALYTRLFGSFEVDNSRTNSTLKFVPPYSTEYGIDKMVQWYKSKE